MGDLLNSHLTPDQPVEQWQTKLFPEADRVLLLFLTSSQVPRLLQNVGSHDPPFLNEPKYDVP